MNHQAQANRLRQVAGIGFSSVFLYLALRRVHWLESWSAMLHSDGRLLALGLVWGLLVYLLFAVRWRVLLRREGGLPLDKAFAYLMLGYFANIILPLRLGDVVRAVLAGRGRKISVSLVLGSVVLERLLDLTVIILLALALSQVVPLTPVLRSSLLLMGSVTLFALLFLALLTFYQEKLAVLAEALPGFIPRRPLEYVLGLMTRFAQGGETLRNPTQLLEVLGLSVLSWVCAGAWTICYVAAFHQSVPWYAGLFVLVLVNLGGAIPSSPGAVGVYHWLAMQALSLWVTDANVRAAYALTTHALNILLIISLGIWALVHEGLSLAGLRETVGR